MEFIDYLKRQKRIERFLTRDQQTVTQDVRYIIAFNSLGNCSQKSVPFVASGAATPII